MPKSQFLIHWPSRCHRASNVSLFGRESLNFFCVNFFYICCTVISGRVARQTTTSSIVFSQRSGGSGNGRTDPREHVVRGVFRKVFRRRRRGKHSEMIDFVTAIDPVQFSSKSELSSRFFGRLKFSPNSRTGGRERKLV